MSEPKTSYLERPEDIIFQGDTFETAAKIVGEEVPEDLKRPEVKAVSLKKKKRAGKKINKKKIVQNNIEDD